MNAQMQRCAAGVQPFILGLGRSLKALGENLDELLLKDPSDMGMAGSKVPAAAVLVAYADIVVTSF